MRLHHGDGEASGPHHVGHGTPGDGPKKPLEKMAILAGPPRTAPNKAQAKSMKNFPPAGLLQKPAEDDEDDHKGGRNPQGHAEDSLAEEVVHPDELIQRDARMIEHSRHVGPDKPIEDEPNGHQGHSHARCPPRGLQH